MSRPVPGLLALLLAVGCAPKEEAPPALTLSVEALDFGEVPVGSPSTLSFTLENAGGGVVDLLSISLIEGSSAVWGVAAEGDASELAAGEALTVRVTFGPTQQVPYDGRVQVRSDDAENPNLYVALSGDGGASVADADGDGYAVADGDCDDGNPAIHPGAEEACDGRDTDCDGTVPVDEQDADRDGWLGCEGDCDDGDGAVFPGAPEICDDKDSNCDGISADREDRDGDGHSVCDDDCDDDEARVYPGNPEVCDGLDNDCSGDWDDIDLDGDSHSPCGLAGDCDDEDPSAYPVLVDATATGAGDGTEANPFRTVDEALAALDRVCRTVQLAPGTYEVGVSWTGGTVTLGGGGRTPDEVVLTAPAGDRHLAVSGGDVTLANLTLTGGAVSGDGGAVRVVNGAVTLDTVVLADNTCTGDGGAVAVASGTLTVADAVFERNVAVDDGGAISVLSGTFTDRGSVYTANEAVRGGAMMLESSLLDLADLSVGGNVAAEEGGGLEIIGGAGVRVERLWVAGNEAGTRGGGLSVVNLADDEAVLRNLVVADNVAGANGGGVAVTGSVAAFLLANSTLVGNVAPGEGAGLLVDVTDAAGLHAWSNLVGWSDGASGVWVGPTAGGSVAYTLAYATTSGTDLDLGGADAGENASENPLFTAFSNDGDPTDDTLSLAAGSPARNSGPVDGEGPATYPDWNDPDGSRNDRGATGGPGASP